jgi:hypothetical protein
MTGPIAWIDADTVAYALGRGIRAYNLAARTDRQIWLAPANERVTGLAASRDGRMLAVTMEARDGSSWSVVGIPPSGDASPERLLASKQAVQAEDWMPSGRALVVSIPSATAAAPAVDLVIEPIGGGPRDVLLRGLSGLRSARVDPDGRRIAVVLQTRRRLEISHELPPPR